jgi:TldD protein
MRPVLLALALVTIAPTLALADARDGVLDAMATELARGQKELKLDGYQAPYFMEFRLIESQTMELEGRFGALVDDDRQKKRLAAVNVRVGSYDFDSTPAKEDYLFDSLSTFRPPKNAPLDDDAEALKATFWLLADQAYKKAVAAFLRKKASKVNGVEDKKIPSFSREEPRHHTSSSLKVGYDALKWGGILRRVSARFRADEDIMDGSVALRAGLNRLYLVNTEGTRVVRDRVIYSLAINAVTRAADGQLLDQGRTIYGRAIDELPDEKEIGALVDLVTTELAALRMAPVADPYTGPAILESEATGVFFHETVGHRLEGERQNDDREGQTFKGRLGAKILPDFITVRDDPTTRRFGDVSLNGYYTVDEQGVSAQNVVLVKNGVLKTFLTSRTPLESVKRSNGHGRAEGIRTPVARMSNLIVEGNQPVSPARLKALLLEEVKRQGKPYGLIIRDITGGSTNTSSYGYQAFKGTPRMVYRVAAETGKETLVRGVEMVGTPLTAVSKILATASNVGVFNGYCGAESGYVPVSTVAPPTLFREIELQRSQRAKQKRAILPPPWR